MFASTHVRGGDADGPPAAVSRCARGRVDDVVELLRAAAPAADGRARRREATGRDRDRLARRIGSRGVVVGDTDRPSAVGRVAGDGDVTPEARRGRRHRSRNGSRRLRGRRPAPSRSRRGRARRPPGCGPCPRPRSTLTARQPGSGRRCVVRREAVRWRVRRVGCQFGEVAVVAEHTEHAAEGRVDVAVGQPRGAQRDVDRVEQQGAGSHRLARGARSRASARSRRGSDCTRRRRRRGRARAPRGLRRGAPRS